MHIDELSFSSHFHIVNLSKTKILVWLLYLIHVSGFDKVIHFFGQVETRVVLLWKQLKNKSKKKTNMDLIFLFLSETLDSITCKWIYTCIAKQFLICHQIHILDLCLQIVNIINKYKFVIVHF